MVKLDIATDLLKLGDIKKTIVTSRDHGMVVQRLKLILEPSLPYHVVQSLWEQVGGEYDYQDNSITLLMMVRV